MQTMKVARLYLGMLLNASALPALPAQPAGLSELGSDCCQLIQVIKTVIS